MEIESRVEQSRADMPMDVDGSIVPSSEGTLLDSITSKPAPNMLNHAPAVLEKRVWELLRDAISAHADAELDCFQHPGVEAAERAKICSQRLWVLAPALLAIPTDGKADASDDEKAHTKFEVVDM
eukprot:12240569-Karenia_brevis.AAC.1